MLEKVIEIKNKSGIHARPASMLVREASKYKSDITIIKGNSELNTKEYYECNGYGSKMRR